MKLKKKKKTKSTTEHIKYILQSYAGSKRFAEDAPSQLAAGGGCQPI